MPDQASIPPPTILCSGYLSLKRNSSPGLIAPKGRRAEGCQKLTSSNERARRNSNQSLSVTATNARIARMVTGASAATEGSAEADRGERERE